MPNVYVITYDTQYDLCMSFVRMQEFYESPKFRNKYFTLEEFMDYWSIEQGNGSFDYPARWSGFNLPSKVIDKWVNLYAGSDNVMSIRDRECEILETIDTLGWEEAVDEEPPSKYYVIGVNEGKSEEVRKNVIEHECAHALYYLCPAYKKECNGLIGEMEDARKDKALDKLSKMGYGKNVFKDEMQAYFSTEEQISALKGLSGIKEFAQNLNKYKEKWAKK